MKAPTPDAEPRPVCLRCRRPESVCYCAYLTSIPTKTRVIVLQHPRERHVAIGTARMAALCLPNAELHQGVDWDGSPELARALSDPTRPAALLFPSEGAIDVLREPPTGPCTLVVIDGTWSQAKKLVRRNPRLAALPRYTFTPPTPSEYRIRREPKETYVSTIEALVHVLSALEGEGDRFRALLVPFRAMIDGQIACEKRFNAARVRHQKGPKEKKDRRPTVLRERWDDLVCVVGEANAWPYDAGERRRAYPDELIHWVACRPSTGETLDVVVAPTHPIAPNTPRYIGIDEATLRAGGARAELHEVWRAFQRPEDLLCSWGRYATRLFAESGGALPRSRLDLRQQARILANGRVGTLEQYFLGSGAGTEETFARGRAGMRLGEIVGVVRQFAALCSE